MIAWPDPHSSGIAAQTAAIGIRPAATPPLGDWLVRAPSAVRSTTTAATDEPVPIGPDDARPAFAQPGPARRQLTRRLWSGGAIAVSAAAHAAAIYALIGFASPDGMEVETDAISVEIVVGQPGDAGSPGIAGNAPEAQDEASTAETETAMTTPALDEAPFDENTAIDASDAAANPDMAAPVDAQEPTELEELAAADADTALSVAESVPAAEPPPVSRSESQTTVLVADPFVAALREPPTFPAQVPVLSVDLPPMDSSVAAALASPPPIEPSPVAPDKPGPVAAEPARQEAPPAKATPRKATEQAAPDRTLKPKTKTAEAATKPPRAAPPKKKPTAAAPDADKAETAAGRKAADKASNRTASVAGNAPKTGASSGAEAKYARRIHGHVQRFRRYPQEAARAGTKGAVKVSITIDRSGRLSAARIGKTSGHAVLDNEAIATARRAAPYPRPPDGVGGATLDISFTLRFNG